MAISKKTKKYVPLDDAAISKISFVIRMMMDIIPMVKTKQQKGAVCAAIGSLQKVSPKIGDKIFENQMAALFAKYTTQHLATKQR